MLEQTATKATDALFNQGVLGTVCVLLILALIVAGFVIRALYRDVQAINKINLDDRDRLIKAQIDAANAADKVGEVLDKLAGMISAGKDSDASFARLFEGEARELRHAVAAVQSSLNGIASRLERTIDRPREPERGRGSDRGHS